MANYVTVVFYIKYVNNCAKVKFIKFDSDVHKNSVYVQRHKNVTIIIIMTIINS